MCIRDRARVIDSKHVKVVSPSITDIEAMTVPESGTPVSYTHLAIAGIPSMVNDFTGGSFMETHYHSQFDNDDFFFCFHRCV